MNEEAAAGPAKAMTKTAYAAHKGVSRRAVYKALDAGRIAEAVLPDGRIDVVLADRLWRERTHPTQGKPIGSIRREDLCITREEWDAAMADPDALWPRHISATVLMHYKAEVARLEYEQRAESLISAAEVAAARRRAAQVTRDIVMELPDRLAEPLARTMDALEVHALIMGEIRGAIYRIVDCLKS